MAQIVMHFGEPRPDRECSQERVGRLIELATIIQGPSQIVVNRRILWIQVESLEVTLDRLIEIALFLEHHAEAIVDNRKSGLQL